MPSSLATSGTVAPAASFASAWRSLRTICSGECRLPIKSPPYARLGLSDSHSNWTRFWGAGQMLEVSTLVYARWNPPEGSNLADLEGVWNDLFIQCKRLLRASRNGIS